MIARPPARCPNRPRSPRRRGVVLLESGIVYSVTLLLLLGVMIMGLGVFQYQQLTALAREGARWASVRGPKYQSEQSASAITAADILNNAVLPRAAVLDSTALKCSLDSTAWGKGQASVTLTYTWTPAAYWSPVTLNSTAVAPILY